MYWQPVVLNRQLHLNKFWPSLLMHMCITRLQQVNTLRLRQNGCHFFNSLASGRPGCHFKTAIFNLVLLIGIFTLSNHNALRWVPRDLTDDKSTLVQVMAWCHQATNHYLGQCWPSSMSPYGVTRPQWVNENIWISIEISLKFIPRGPITISQHCFR